MELVISGQRDHEMKVGQQHHDKNAWSRRSSLSPTCKSYVTMKCDEMHDVQCMLVISLGNTSWSDPKTPLKIFIIFVFVWPDVRFLSDSIKLGERSLLICPCYDSSGMIGHAAKTWLTNPWEFLNLAKKNLVTGIAGRVESPRTIGTGNRPVFHIHRLFHQTLLHFVAI